MSNLKTGDLGDCDCGAEVAQFTEKVQFKAPVQTKKPRKKKSKGAGSFCVVSHKDKIVHCYNSEATAERVAKAFSARGRAGTKFRVSKRDR